MEKTDIKQSEQEDDRVSPDRMIYIARANCILALSALVTPSCSFLYSIFLGPLCLLFIEQVRNRFCRGGNESLFGSWRSRPFRGNMDRRGCARKGKGKGKEKFIESIHIVAMSRHWYMLGETHHHY